MPPFHHHSPWGSYNHQAQLPLAHIHSFLSFCPEIQPYKLLPLCTSSWIAYAPHTYLTPKGTPSKWYHPLIQVIQVRAVSSQPHYIIHSALIMKGAS